jgi:hypothetical protein
MPTLEAASSVQCLHVVDERPGIDVAEPVHIDTGPLADLEGRRARGEGGAAYCGRVGDDHEGDSMSDRDRDTHTDTDTDQQQRRGRLRLQWPTFRGSPFLWGVLAFPLFLHLLTAGVSLGRGEGPTPFGVVFLVLVAVVFVICLIGVVQTLRHPRPSRPSWLDEGDPRA